MLIKVWNKQNRLSLLTPAAANSRCSGKYQALGLVFNIGSSVWNEPPVIAGPLYRNGSKLKKRLHRNEVKLSAAASSLKPDKTLGGVVSGRTRHLPLNFVFQEAYLRGFFLKINKAE